MKSGNCQRFGLSNLPFIRYNSCKIIKSLLHLDSGGHGDRSTNLLGGQKRCYDGQAVILSAETVNILMKFQHVSNLCFHFFVF